MFSISSRRAFRSLQVTACFVSLAWFGLVGCSNGGGSSENGGSTGKSSAGQSGSSSSRASGGQSSQGGSSSSSVSPSGGSGGDGQSSGGTGPRGGTSTGGSSSKSSTSGGAGCTCGGTSTRGTGGTGGTGGTRTGGTGGMATGGTGGSSQGGQDGGAGTGGTSSSPDGGVDRTPDTASPIPDGGSAGVFCPSDGTACKIMAMGDSITDGVGSTAPGGGYRLPLFKLALTDSKNLTFVGRNTNGPTTVSVNGQTKQFPQGHEGYSGWTIKDGGGRQGIYNKVDGAMQTNLPHIILLMIGTNDVDINLDVANAPNRLGELLDKIIADAPKALIVVAKLVPTKDDNENFRFRVYNDGIVAPVQARVGQGKNIIMVDMYKAFTDNANYKTALMADNLHPKDAGYSVMAQTWYDAIKQYLH